MGPKKKRRTAPPPAKPGIARQHITDNFKSLPGDGICRNGHILFMFLENERSATKTIRAVNERFGFRPALSQILNLVAKSIHKFKGLSRESEKQRFDDVCQDVFHIREDLRDPESFLPPSSSDSKPVSVITEMAATSMTRWGILGAGKIANDFVKAFADAPKIENNKIVGVAARDIKRAREFATKHKIDKFYGSYEELAKDPEIDVIYMGNMHTHHLQEGKMCLDNGKHLLVEKPLTTNYKDSKELLDYAKSKKLFLMEALWSRFFPANSFIKETIAAGKIGEPVYLTATFAHSFGPLDNDNVSFGAQYFMGVYPLQAALAIFEGKPEKVSTTAVKNQLGVVVTVTYTLTFKNGGVAQLMSSRQYNSTNRLLLEGTKGTIEIPNHMWAPTEVIVNGEKHEFPLPKFDQADYTFIRSVGLFQEVAPVADCIGQGLLECPLMPHEDTLTMAKINDQVLLDSEK